MISKRWTSVILIVLLAAGCAMSPPEDDRLDGLESRLAADAWLLDGTAVLKFDTEAGREVYAVSHWEDVNPARDSYDHLITRLEYVDNDWPEGLPRQRSFRPIPVLPASRWQALLVALTDQLVPTDPKEALLLLVQRRQLVVFRTPSGDLQTLPASEMPEGVEIVNSCDQQAFLERAAGILEDYADELELSDRAFLFQTAGEEGSGVRYILVDLAARQIVSLNSAVPAEVVDDLGLIALSTQGASSILWRSHVLTFIKNPITSVARLVNFALTTTYNLIYVSDHSVETELPDAGQSEPMDMAEWEARLDRLASRKPYRGTLDLLIDGEAFFASLLDDIGRAHSSIDFRIYIFDRDDYAVRIADLLKDRSGAVQVRVLMDDLGSLAGGILPPATPPAPDFEPPASIVEYLRRDSQVTVRRASNPWFTADHTKSLIFDDRIAYVGGMNIGREYRSEWHDLMVRLEGPIVDEISHEFEKAWGHAGWAGDFGYAWNAMSDRPHAKVEGEGILIRPLYTKTARREILKAQVEALRRSRQYVYVQNAYLSDDSILNGLIDARRRGVDVRVIIPTGNDSGIMGASNAVTANMLIRNGVRVYAYPGMTHVKAAIYDGWATLGSANFDKLSLYVNQELNLAFSDPETVGRLKRELFEADFEVSEELVEPIVAGWSDYLYAFLADQL